MLGEGGGRFTLEIFKLIVKKTLNLIIKKVTFNSNSVERLFSSQALVVYAHTGSLWYCIPQHFLSEQGLHTRPRPSDKTAACAKATAPPASRPLPIYSCLLSSAVVLCRASLSDMFQKFGIFVYIPYTRPFDKVRVDVYS